MVKEGQSGPRDRRRMRRQTTKRPLRTEWMTHKQGKQTKTNERLDRTRRKLM